MNYIHRKDWIGNELSEKCCKKVICPAGHHIKKCSLDGGEDKCEPCPKFTWMSDETNSDNPFQCEEVDTCPFGSTRVDYFPKSDGCHKPCICDTYINHYGYDSCNCKTFTGKCSFDTILALNGSCLPKRIANAILNDLKPDNFVSVPLVESTNKTEFYTKENGNGTLIIKRQNDIVAAEIIAGINDSSTNSSVENARETEITFEYGSFKIGRIIITCVATPVSMVVLIVIIVFTVAYIRRKYRDNPGNPAPIPDEEMTLVKFPDRLRNDSGISMSANPAPIPDEKMTRVKFPDRLSNDSGISISSNLENNILMNEQEQDQFSSRVKQFAFVSPIPRDQAGQEGSAIEPSTVETCSNGTRRLAISASSREYSMDLT
ncbi:uncharacterized protein LOC127710384 [Mytilus californianus]|uniref:uncharacterized protein LOC127710384 n=1 Tax=Mytilus californianus TaxID=6549 RepID=UPI0022472510|nr:uncharacterized protein LOC127710384 [Mytilus californianus]